jgi:hypothetical protein
MFPHPKRGMASNSRSANSLFRALTFAVIAACLLASAGIVNATPPADTDHFLWKPVPVAQCKLDDKIPLAWNIYQTADKKQAQYVLILLGRRYIALDLKAHQAYVVFLSDLTKQGSDWESGDLFQSSRTLPTENWTLRDVGPAELIRLTLKDYNRQLQIELPHPPDLRAFY